MNKKLIVIKVGTSSLTNGDGSLSPEKVKKTVLSLAELKKQGHQAILVTSGSIAAGFRRLGYNERPKAVAAKQAAAAVGQGLLMEEYTKYLDEHGYVSAQLLLTRDDFRDKRRYMNAFNALEVLLAKGAVPIINENDTVSVDELKLGDNDTLSAMVAATVHADLLVILTDISGFYTGDPRKDSNATLIERVEAITPDLMMLGGGSGTGNGTGGMHTKLKGAALATSAGVGVYICSAERNISDVIDNKVPSTYFCPKHGNMKTRLQWMAFYAPCKGSVYVDEGAAEALTQHSLLPSGIVAVEGDFKAGDVVKVYRPGKSASIGRGIINYDCGELKAMMGLSSSQLKDESHNKKIEAIHRDNWVAMEEENE